MHAILLLLIVRTGVIVDTTAVHAPRPTEQTTYGTVENQPREDEVGAPPVEVLQQHCGKGCERERPKPRAADGDARSQRPLGLEVVTDTYHSRKVDQAETDACNKRDPVQPCLVS
jgi:hypothetical protein